MADRASPEEPQSLYLLSLETGQKQKLTSPTENSIDKEPAFSPDGRAVAFIRGTASGTQDVYIQRQGGDSTRLTFDENRVAGVDWMRNGKDLVFSALDQNL